MKRICAFLTVVVLILIGCGGKEKIKPSADSIITQNSLRVIETVKDAYQKKDRTALQENMSPELSEDIAKKLSFESAVLSFTPRMVKLKGSLITINLNWYGTWTIQNKTIKNRGVAVFVLEGDPVKLVRVEGENPFLTPAVE